MRPDRQATVLEPPGALNDLHLSTISQTNQGAALTKKHKISGEDLPKRPVGLAGLILLAGMLFTTASHALYRCGNTYQDKPCASAATDTPVNPALRLAPAAKPVAASPTAAQPATATNSASFFAAACGRVGLAAQQMVWKREGGATREKQLTDLPQGAAHAEMVNTLDSVYSRRGSAPEVRAAIESECVVEKQKQADAVAALKALTEQAGAQAAPSGPGAAATATAGSNAADKPPQQVAEATKAAAVANCKRLRTQDDALRADMPKRGSAEAMQTYNDKKRRLDTAISDAKC